VSSSAHWPRPPVHILRPLSTDRLAAHPWSLSSPAAELVLVCRRSRSPSHILISRPSSSAAVGRPRPTVRWARVSYHVFFLADDDVIIDVHCCDVGSCHC
jgi:hypothetical protein